MSPSVLGPLGTDCAPSLEHPSPHPTFTLQGRVPSSSFSTIGPPLCLSGTFPLVGELGLLPPPRPQGFPTALNRKWLLGVERAAKG
jgi:hypothetical protein